MNTNGKLIENSVNENGSVTLSWEMQTIYEMCLCTRLVKAGRLLKPYQWPTMPVLTEDTRQSWKAAAIVDNVRFHRKKVTKLLL
jgi:hypothetical protein